MKNLILLTVLSLSLLTTSCYSSEGNDTLQSLETIQNTHQSDTDTVEFVSFFITAVDDETGYAEGYTHKIDGVQITNYRVVAPYSALKYEDSTYYLNLNVMTSRLNAGDSLCVYEIDSYDLVGTHPL